MKNFFATFIFSTLLFSMTINAEEANPLAAFNAKNGDVYKALQDARDKGHISQADYEKTKKALMNMNNPQINSLNNTSVGQTRLNLEKAVAPKDGKSIDNEEIKKQINNLSNYKHQ